MTVAIIIHGNLWHLDFIKLRIKSDYGVTKINSIMETTEKDCDESVLINYSRPQELYLTKRIPTRLGYCGGNL